MKDGFWGICEEFERVVPDLENELYLILHRIGKMGGSNVAYCADTLVFNGVATVFRSSWDFVTDAKNYHTSRECRKLIEKLQLIGFVCVSAAAESDPGKDKDILDSCGKWSLMLQIMTVQRLRICTGEEVDIMAFHGFAGRRFERIVAGRDSIFG